MTTGQDYAQGAPRSMVVPARRRDLRENELDGEAVLADPITGKMHHLNSAALTLWRRCDGLLTTHELARRQSEAFDVPLERALDDVEQLVSVLAASDLLILQAGR